MRLIEVNSSHHLSNDQSRTCDRENTAVSSRLVFLIFDILESDEDDKSEEDHSKEEL